MQEGTWPRINSATFAVSPISSTTLATVSYVIASGTVILASHAFFPLKVSANPKLKE